jgi:Cu+-exporting ATPase
MSTATLAQSNCLHCGALASSGAAFCCTGCHSIYSLLQEKDLLNFYDTQKGLALREEIYLPLTSLEASFYREGIHCLGCLWILEKLPELNRAIVSSKLNFGIPYSSFKSCGPRRLEASPHVNSTVRLPAPTP